MAILSSKHGGVGQHLPGAVPGTKEILVVDDDEQVLYLLSEILRHQGYHVTCRSDVPSALEGLRKLRPDLVLLDMCMLGTDGTAFLENAGHYLPGGLSSPPIIVLSVIQDQEIVDFAMEHGVRDYITKPFDPEKLVKKVAEYFH